MTFPLFKGWYSIHFKMYTFLRILIFPPKAHIIPAFGKSTIYTYKKEDSLNESILCKVLIINTLQFNENILLKLS